MNNQKQYNVRVAAAQFSPIFLDKTETIKKACDIIIEAGANKTDLVVFPEVFIPGYPDWVWVVPNSNGAVLNELYTELVRNAITIPDKYTDQLCEAAKKAKVFVAIGVHERNTEASNSSLYNTILYINKEGQIAGKHRKLMPTGGERLIWAQGDGSTLNTYDTDFGKVGGLICWENYMPLARQALYQQGIQILVAPTWDKSDNWLSSLTHIAREGGVFVINCCMAIRLDEIPEKYEFRKLYPEGREWMNFGNSCIINPKGEFIAGPVKEKEEIIYADIDLSQISAAKRMFDAAGHYARPDVFEFKVKKQD